MLRRRKRLSEGEVRFYIRQLVEGIEYMHKNLVIHRDLKLGNLFLTSEMEIKIGDFGLATRLDNLYDRKRTMCGTPNYIAPEILNGQRGDGHSFEVDIWSTGVVMYTLLVGRPPFETEDVKDTYKRIRANQYGFPEDTTVSESAQALIRSILRSEPHLRPSLKAILAHPFFRDEPIPASLPRTALLITPPDCKRKPIPSGENRASAANVNSDQLRATHPIPLAPRRYPLRSRDVNARNSNSGEHQPEETRAVPHSSAKPDLKRDVPASLTRNTRSAESTSPPPMPSPSLPRKSEERAAVTQDPLETIYSTLARFFDLEEKDTRDENLNQYSSASKVVAAAKRLKEIRAETDDIRHSKTLFPATLWVSQWVDYTSKYGMGYMLTNGSSGVYYNDSTKAIASPNGQFFEYLERLSDVANAVEQRVRYSTGKHDPSLAKKVTLLKHFKSYLVDGRAENEEAGVLERQLADLMHPEVELEAIEQGKPMEFVKKWVKTRHAVLFCLSNGTLQINFFDSSKLLLSGGGRVVTYLDKEDELAVFSTAVVVLKSERPDLLKRLRYAKDMLQQMLRVQVTSTSGK